MLLSKGDGKTALDGIINTLLTGNETDRIMLYGKVCDDDVAVVADVLAALAVDDDVVADDVDDDVDDDVVVVV